MKLRVVDRIETSLADGVCDADMVVLAVPVGSCGEILAQLAPYLAADAVVTDVGSVKGSVVTVARATLGARFPAFVPGHPIAGSERSGVAASLTELFRKRRVVLTPCVETDTCAVERVAQMWLAAGAEIVTMSVSHHDEILAATSHLPHLLAYTLVDMLARAENSRDLFSSAAGGVPRLYPCRIERSSDVARYLPKQSRGYHPGRRGLPSGTQYLVDCD